MSGKNFMSFGDADTILTEFSNDIKSRVSTKANQGLTAQQQANAKTNIGIENVPNVATNDQTPTFLEESSRVNINSGDKLSLIFGKIKKFFSDLKAVAFSGSYNDLSNKPTIPSALADLTTDNVKGAVRYGKTWGSTLSYSFDLDGLIIDQRQNESSGVQFNGDYISFWSPADGGYSMRYFDEDNGKEIWNIDASGKFSGTIDWARVNGSSQALRMKGWWASGSSNNADNLNNGSVFAYAASHNTPTTGPLFAFASEDGNKYVAQVQFQYNGDAVYHRVKNGDNNTWRAWQAFKSQADVDSAYSSGRTQGRNDVKNSPNSYGLYTKAQYDTNYSSGRTQGQNDVKNSPGTYGLYTKAQYDANYKSGWNAAKKWAVDNYLAKAPYSTGGAIYGATGNMSSVWPYSERHYAAGLNLLSGDLYLSVNSSASKWEYDIRLTKSV